MKLRNRELKDWNNGLPPPPKNFDLTKNFSLRHESPLSFLELRSQGETIFSLPEVLFDADRPGNTHRKIKSVTVSVLCYYDPAIEDPAPLDCYLSLEKNSYRTSSSIPEGTYESQGATDSRSVHAQTPVECVATGTCQIQKDFGIFFFFRFNASFEEAGVISTWKLQLRRPASSLIDFASMFNAGFDIEYTSQDGGKELKTAARSCFKDHLRADRSLYGDLRMVDLNFDLQTGWGTRFDRWRKQRPNEYNGGSLHVNLHSVRGHLPWYERDYAMAISKAYILCKTKPGSGAGIKNVIVNGTVFVQQTEPDLILPDYRCLGIMENEDAFPWPQDEWTMDIECADARQISEMVLLYSGSCVVPE